VKFRPVVSEICEQTERHTDQLIAILCTRTGGEICSNAVTKLFKFRKLILLTEARMPSLEPRFSTENSTTKLRHIITSFENKPAPFPDRIRHLSLYYAIPAFTARPQSVTALWLVLIFCPAEGRRLSSSDHKPTWITRPQTVTHLSILLTGLGVE